METKNYELLRPFDLEAAKRGEPVCDRYRPEVAVKFIAHAAGLVEDERVVIQVDGRNLLCGENGEYHGYGSIYLRMAPLCWVEGRPVYRGEVLWACAANGDWHEFVVAGAMERKNQGGTALYPTDGRDGWLPLSRFRWTPPKVKSDVKLLAFIDEQGFLRHVREELFCNRGLRAPMLDCIIPIEEPAGAAK